MDQRFTDLIKQGDQLFSKRGSLTSLWQDAAENFYPERADFTVTRSLGDDFASNLTTSYPLMVRRELGNSIGTMLRPTPEWFETTTDREDRLTNEDKRWLEWATGLQRRAMYDRVTMFTRATKEADHDWATFGQAVISTEFNRRNQALLYRCWHLRDVVWCENSFGEICQVHRKQKMRALDIKARFRNISPRISEKIAQDPYCELEIRHIVIMADEYEPMPGAKAWRQPFVSIYIDVEHGHCMEEVGSWIGIYTIPRWQTVSGSQYAYSPAMVAALPDARLLQAMTLSLLEAGEKAANPPMLATEEAVRSDMQLYAGGVTWVDAEYDERLGEVLRPISQDYSGLPTGLTLRNDTRAQLSEAFFLNAINMPFPDREMTAFEVAKRIEEYVRRALPLFEPVEADYNAHICEDSFELLLRNGAYGGPQDIPESLQGQSIRFRFRSPFRQAADEAKAQRLLQAKQLATAMVDVDPQSLAMLNGRVALRDALEASAPAKWIRSEKEMEGVDLQAAQKQQAQELLASASQAAQVTTQMGEAAQAIGAAA